MAREGAQQLFEPGNSLPRFGRRLWRHIFEQRSPCLPRWPTVGAPWLYDRRPCEPAAALARPRSSCANTRAGQQTGQLEDHPGAFQIFARRTNAPLPAQPEPASHPAILHLRFFVPLLFNSPAFREVKVLMNVPADSSPRSSRWKERGIYPAGPCEEGACREVRTPSCSGTFLRTQVRAPLRDGA